MPVQGILNTARSLSFYLRQQEVTANNLANANTDAFKCDRITAQRLPNIEHPIPVERTDFQQAALRQTGRPLDVGIDGPGFLVVSTPDGERLTRGGSLRLDVDGRLTDVHGDLLLGIEGPLLLAGNEIEIHDDGTVLTDGGVAGQLRIVSVDDPRTLLKAGFGRYLPPAGTRPAEEGVVRVRQGLIEESNVDPTLSMVDLITIQRAFAANMDALRAQDGVLGTVVNEVGKV